MKQLLIYLLFLCTYGIAIAKPIIPNDDSQVLETLATKALPSAQQEAIRSARERWRADPQNIDVAAKLARLYIGESRRSADPRYLGYAEAVLEPWTKQSTRMPIPIRVLKATIAQRNHQFKFALSEIAVVLKQAPMEPEALLMRATIQQVQADYEGARESCKSLYSLSTLMIGMVCTAQVDGLTGQAESAFQRISKLVNIQQAGLTPEIAEWMLSTQVELAQRIGREEDVSKGFNRLMEGGYASPETKAAYADWLIKHQRFQDVITLTSKEIKDDGLLLRLAIAEVALHLPSAEVHRNLLKDRFAAARLRGDGVHQREEARFTLELLHQPIQALALAQKNWTVQREPADAHVLLAAAIAAHQPVVATPVMEWLKRSNIQDMELHRQASSLSRRELGATAQKGAA